jgi:hypothetical protein
VRIQAQSESTLDRTPQNLPVPLGGWSPAHHDESRLSRTWRRQRARILTAGGLVLGVVGGWLAVAAPSVAVYADGASVHIGAVTLLPVRQQPTQGVRVYTGAVAFVVVDVSPRETRASAVTLLNGVSVNGVCRLTRTGGAGAREECAFSVRGTALRSTDLFDSSSHTWRRTYSDGRTATFNVPPGTSVVPIPIPLGR